MNNTSVVGLLEPQKEKANKTKRRKLKKNHVRDYEANDFVNEMFISPTHLEDIKSRIFTW